jgi:S1-C subfamily serine protease
MTRRLALVALLCLPGFAAAEENVYKKGLKSTVWIVQEVGRTGTRVSLRTGSGAVIDTAKRLVLTNYHVVGDQKEATILFPMFDKGSLIPERDRYMDLVRSGKGIKAKVLFSEQSKDLAVIQLETLPPGTPTVRLAKDSPSPGDRVHSIGSPGISAGLFNYTDGSVKIVVHRDIKARRAPGEPDLMISAKMIETSSGTNKGDSGGPLLNDKCELVGVTQGYVVGGDDARPVSLFIDVSEVKNLLKTHKITLSTSPGTSVATDTPKADNPDKPGDKPAVAAAEKSDSAKDKRKQEETAASRLSGAKLFLNSNKKEAKKQLQQIVDEFPGTEAAGDAKKLLDTLK